MLRDHISETFPLKQDPTAEETCGQVYKAGFQSIITPKRDPLAIQSAFTIDDVAVIEISSGSSYKSHKTNNKILK